MEKKSTFRLRLNLFDGIVLILALAAAAFLLWRMAKPAPAEGPVSSASTVRYTVRFQRWIEGSDHMVNPGDQLVDNIKNNELGQVVSKEVLPAVSQQLDNQGRRYVLATADGFEDVLVTVEAPCVRNDDGFVLGSNFALRVGAMAYIRGEGYMASGPIISIEREGQA